jgi:hypothetical protein
MNSSLLEISLVFVLLLANGVFAMTEIAIGIIPQRFTANHGGQR